MRTGLVPELPAPAVPEATGQATPVERARSLTSDRPPARRAPMITARTHRTRPRTAGATTALAESSPTEKLQRTLPNAAMAITSTPSHHALRQNAAPRRRKKSGTVALKATFASVQVPRSHYLSTARNSWTPGSTRRGAGNQAMLVASARRVTAIPAQLRPCEERERDQEERADVPAQRVVVALPSPVEEIS